MQRDNLEKFILVNREEFDDSIPGLKTWSAIDSALDRRISRRVSLWRISRVAAAVVALLVVGALVGSYLTRVQNQEMLSSLENISPGYAEMAMYYDQQIDAKYQQLVNYRQQSEVDEDMAHLDEVMEELRRELSVAPKGNEGKIVETLIKSYQAKIETLEKVLEYIQSNNQQIKPEGDEISI